MSDYNIISAAPTKKKKDSYMIHMKPIHKEYVNTKTMFKMISATNILIPPCFLTQ